MTNSARFAYMNYIKPGEMVCIYGSEKAMMSEIYRTVKTLLAIKRARTMDELKAAFTAPAKQAKADGDTELLTLLTDAKNKRKSELEKA